MSGAGSGPRIRSGKTVIGEPAQYIVSRRTGGPISRWVFVLRARKMPTATEPSNKPNQKTLTNPSPPPNTQEGQIARNKPSRKHKRARSPALMVSYWLPGSSRRRERRRRRRGFILEIIILAEPLQDLGIGRQRRRDGREFLQEADGAVQQPDHFALLDQGREPGALGGHEDEHVAELAGRPGRTVC